MLLRRKLKDYGYARINRNWDNNRSVERDKINLSKINKNRNICLRKLEGSINFQSLLLDKQLFDLPSVLGDRKIFLGFISIVDFLDYFVGCNIENESAY